MSEITIKDVEYVAALSRIALDEQDKEKFVKDLKKIVGYVDQLNELNDELNVKHVEPTFHAWEGKGTLLRKDEAKESFPNKEILQQAPDPRDGFFGVPQVIE